MKPSPAALLLPLVACAGDEETEAIEPIAEWACVHVAEGTILDAGASREEAPEIAIARAPYRVNLRPGAAGFLGFEVDAAADVALLVDFAGAVPALWRGETREALAPGAADPSCPDDLPESWVLSVDAGPHWLEVGPAFQGNVWLLLAPADP